MNTKEQEEERMYWEIMEDRRRKGKVWSHPDSPQTFGRLESTHEADGGTISF